MAYYVDIFSPDTYQKFAASDRSISGFSENKRNTAILVQPGDKLIAYVTKLSRWVGVFEVKSRFFTDNSPIFADEDDPYNIRFQINPVVLLPLEQAIPIAATECWDRLSFTRNLSRDSLAWTIHVRSSLRRISDADGQVLEQMIRAQQESPKLYPLDEADQKKLRTTRVKTQHNKQVAVSIPEDEPELIPPAAAKELPRESLRIQSLLARIGERMGMKIWLPRNDRQQVINLWKPKDEISVLQQLPLNYDEATLSTIENIDVLWIKGRSIVRAFEVEHTTSIYSGILRMADLMALQPNLQIIAHIVAPIERREKVFDEITRPVFTFLEKGPLSESCSFLSYESVEELAKEKRLEYMTDAVLEDFEETAKDGN